VEVLGMKPRLLVFSKFFWPEVVLSLRPTWTGLF